MPIRLFSMLRARLFGDDDHADEPTQDISGRADSEPPVTESPLAVDVGTSVEPPTGDPAVIAARQERAAGRILDDESLRDSLTDDEFQPILDWALGVTDRISSRTDSLDDDAAQEAIDNGIQAIREIALSMHEVLGEHADGRVDPRRRALNVIASVWSRDNPDALDATALQAARERLTAVADRLDADPDLSGGDVAMFVVRALSPSADEESS